MTNENIVPQTPTVQPETKETGSGCLGQLGWFFSGAVLPMGSFSYYRKAAQKTVGSAILFFVVFTVAISALSTIGVAVGTFSLTAGIQKSYAEGKIPEITISNGVAEVSGQQPFILLDGSNAAGQRILVATDTSGTLQEIDPHRYYQGFLLTRTELLMLTPQNGPQAIPLSQLNQAFKKDPLIINAQTMSAAWGVMSTVIVVLAFVFLVLWNTVVRLMIISMIALILWGIVTLIKPNTGFGPIIISGLYAIVPAIYLSHLLSRSNFSFPGVQTLLLLLFWVAALVVNLGDVKPLTNEKPMAIWTALIGLPMLLLFIVDMFWQFPSPYGPIALWAIFILTGLVLIGLRLFFRFGSRPSEQPLTP